MPETLETQRLVMAINLATKLPRLVMAINHCIRKTFELPDHYYAMGGPAGPVVPGVAALLA